MKLSPLGMRALEFTRTHRLGEPIIRERRRRNPVRRIQLIRFCTHKGHVIPTWGIIYSGWKACGNPSVFTDTPPQNVQLLPLLDPQRCHVIDCLVFSFDQRFEIGCDTCDIVQFAVTSKSLTTAFGQREDRNTAAV